MRYKINAEFHKYQQLGEKSVLNTSDQSPGFYFMKSIMLEYFFDCPYCMAGISMLIDPSIRIQQYIEDCEVCCNPIEVQLEIENGNLFYFQAISIEQ